MQDFKKKQDIHQNEHEMEPMMSENESTTEKSPEIKNSKLPVVEPESVEKEHESKIDKSNETNDLVKESLFNVSGTPWANDEQTNADMIIMYQMS